MIGLDTNVLLRYVVQDDARQSPLATQLIETTLSDDEPGWIATVVLCELVWVLEGPYEYARNAIVATLQRLFEIARFRVEQPAIAWRALDAYKSGADFSDAMIALDQPVKPVFMPDALVQIGSSRQKPEEVEA